MSDFPIPEKYRNALSVSHLRFLKENGWKDVLSALPIVVKKEKGAFIYDIDGNKYADFDLNNGSAIAGHDHRTLTQFVKNGLSSGSSSGNINKFTARLVKLFRGLAEFSRIAFFNQGERAYSAVVNAVKPSSIGVTSSYLLELLKPFGAETAVNGKRYGLVFFEPIDFDGKLEDTGIKTSGWTADKTCVVESRTAFRFKNGFLSTTGDADMVLAADCIANGMDSAVVMTASNIPVEGENLPVFKSIAVLETLKYFGRNVDYKIFDMENLRAKENNDFVFRKNIFKILKDFEPAALLPYGVHIKNKIGFISTEHTEFDWKRLENALKMTGKN